MSISTTTVPTITLNDGTSMPQLGYGVFQIPEAQTTAAVSTALETGYRSIDTAAIYGNESGVGRALADSGIPREELFVTTKLWLADLGRETTRDGLAASLDKLGLDHVDLYLIHWPGTDTEAYLESWQVLEELRAAGLSRSIGVSNFLPEQLERIIELGGTVPAVNQVELHPFLQNRETAAVNRAHGIATEAWSPLAQGAVLDDPAVLAAAAVHGVTPAQVVLRWHLQQGNVVIPKSVTASRMASNLDLLGFDLDTDSIAALDALDRDGRTGPFPGTFNG
ncbi:MULTISPECIES: aldo/keto reductase [Micrococcaceae]|uniref:2,5-diketo-D-gluconate reductase A n=1 Tax=Paeniglutamicibacter sulfureus TaxID=43666 RepID=A0ABU2BKE9_9MICC|nr:MULTISPECIES: aldo/keto reductase [Micrococcaceae]MDR7359112.1 2,5-diketo-D-gluconate reductase A [Paeniglutamicibacter sulfureus]OIH85091.1 2,5-diketo-D-gluconic acid reductase [Arthrobacter sp. UCD-GKA]